MGRNITLIDSMTNVFKHVNVFDSFHIVQHVKLALSKMYADSDDDIALSNTCRELLDMRDGLCYSPLTTAHIYGLLNELCTT